MMAPARLTFAFFAAMFASQPPSAQGAALIRQFEEENVNDDLQSAATQAYDGGDDEDLGADVGAHPLMIPGMTLTLNARGNNCNVDGKCEKVDGKYCAVTRNKWKTVNCNSQKPGFFMVANAGDGRIALKSLQTNEYCTDKGNKIDCKAKNIGKFEKFNVEYKGLDGVVLRGSRNKDNYCFDEDDQIKCKYHYVGTPAALKVTEEECDEECHAMKEACRQMCECAESSCPACYGEEMCGQECSQQIETNCGNLEAAADTPTCRQMYGCESLEEKTGKKQLKKKSLAEDTEDDNSSTTTASNALDESLSGKRSC